MGFHPAARSVQSTPAHNTRKEGLAVYRERKAVYRERKKKNTGSEGLTTPEGEKGKKRMGVQRCEISLALIVLISGFTHYE